MMRASLTKFNKLMIGTLNVVLSIVVGFLVLDVVWGVFTRYVLGDPASWTNELAGFLLAWVTLLGGAAAFGTKEHLGVDYFVGKLHPDTRKSLAIFGHLVVLFFALVIFVYGGFKTVSDSFTPAMTQMTPALNLNKGYVYLALPIAGLFMVSFTLENMLETISRPAADLYPTDLEGESK